MKRTMLFLILSLCFATTFAAGLTGYLTQQIPWMAGNEMTLVPLSESKPDTLETPSIEGLKYGLLELGAKPIVFALIPGEIPLLWIDANNNGNMLDDPTIAPDFKETHQDTTTYEWITRVKVFYELDGYWESRSVKLLARKTGLTGELEFRYCLYEHMEGLVWAEDGPRKIKLFTLDPKGFYYTDQVYFGVDTDGDGEIALIHDSYEIFLHGEVFSLNGKAYRLCEVSEDGKKVSFEETKETPVEKPRFLKGQPLPIPGVLQTDPSLNAAFFKGSPSLIVLSKVSPATVVEPVYTDCDCSSLSAFERFRLDGIIDLARRYAELKVLWVLTGKEQAQPEAALLENIYLRDERSLVDFYGFPGEERVFIADSKGVIIELDRYWVDEASLETDRPQNGKLMLSYSDIKNTVEALYKIN
ncbi:hypothetical protein DS66_06670 [Mesotoga sp. SC_3PWM13N19]|nr:hypothetical protein DS66_06670 [Mesotoga sp. SC_3PWM13N19]